MAWLGVLVPFILVTHYFAYWLGRIAEENYQMKHRLEFLNKANKVYTDVD